MKASSESSIDSACAPATLLLGPILLMNLLTRLALIFNIHQGEGRLVNVLLAHSFAIGAARIFTRTAAFALFLAAYDATSLPYIYMGIAISASLCSFAYLKLANRLEFPHLLITNLGFLALSLGGVRLGLEVTGHSWIVFALPIWYEVLWTLTNLEFWNLAGRLVTVRQGKRLFGVVAAGESVALVIGGFFASPLVRLIGTPNLLLLAAVAVLAALGCVLATTRSFPDKLIKPAEKGPANERRVRAHLLQNRFVLLTFGLVTLEVVTYFFIDNVFYAHADTRYPDEAALAGFIGAFFAVVGIGTLVTRALLTGRLFSRYGLRFSMLLTVMVLIANTGTLVAVEMLGGVVVLLFGLAALNRLLCQVFLEGIEIPALNVLYQPLPAAERVRVQTAVEGIVYPLSIGLAGLLLWLLTTPLRLSLIHLVVILLGLLVVRVLFALLTMREYRDVLMTALAKRRLGSGPSLFPVDRSCVGVLQSGLKSPHPGTVIYSLNMLATVAPESLLTNLEALLAHPAAEVRQEVLHCTERQELRDATERVQHHLAMEAVPAVRGAALRTLAVLGEPEVLEFVAAHLHDPLPEVRLGALVGLLRSGDIAGIVTASQALLALVDAPDPSDRAFAARVLEEASIKNLYRPLLQLLQDADPQVRRAALSATARVHHRALWPAVCDNLASANSRSAAVASLGAAGEEALPVIENALARPGQSRDVKLRLLRLCGRIGGERAQALLLANLEDADAEVRPHVLAALARSGYQAQGAERAHIDKQVREEVARATWALAAIVDLKENEQVALLRAALSHQIDQHRENLLALLAFLYDRETILQVRASLAHPGAEMRAYGLEALDMVVAHEHSVHVAPLFAELPPEQELKTLAASFPQLQMAQVERLHEILTVPTERVTSWLRACALYSLRQQNLSTAPSVAVVAANLSSADPLIRETALWTIGKLDQNVYREYASRLEHGPGGQDFGMVLWRDARGNNGGARMLTTIEKVMILKAVELFAETPDEILAKIAMLLEEVEFAAGETIFSKGDLGTSMYIIVQGEVRVHDGERILNDLGEREVFGEMAVLERQPRMATVTAQTETRLLRLEQDPLYELMEDRIEVARGIIRVLSQRVRARVADVMALQAQLDVPQSLPEPKAR